MASISLQKCLSQLKKPSEERNIEFIIPYLETLPSLMNMLKADLSQYTYILSELSRLMQYDYFHTQELIIRNGERGLDFYIILNGSVSILTFKNEIYELNEEEYWYHLLKIRQNNELDLLRQIINLNNSKFPIEDNFDFFVKKIKTQSESLSPVIHNSKILKEKADETWRIIKQTNKQINKLITVDQYMELNKVEILYPKNKNTVDKKSLVIPNYKVINTLMKGQVFGDISNDNVNKKRTGTIITNDRCDLGKIYIKDYNILMRSINEKSQKRFVNLMYSYTFFKGIPSCTFEKKYYDQFHFRIFNRGDVLIDSEDNNAKYEHIYFISSGEYELTIEKNIIDINKLIIYYKNRLSTFMNQKDSTWWEEKENEDLINNKRFNTETENEYLFEKRVVRLGIIHTREIIGLEDYVCHKTFKGLVSCRAASNNTEVYMTKRSTFNDIVHEELKVKDWIQKFLEKKIEMMLSRLIQHKEKVFNSIKYKHAEISKMTKKMYDKGHKYNNTKKLFTWKTNPKIFLLGGKSIMDSNSIPGSPTQIKTQRESVKKIKLNINSILPPEFMDRQKFKKSMILQPQEKQFQTISNPHSDRYRNSNNSWGLFKNNVFKRNAYDTLWCECMKTEGDKKNDKSWNLKRNERSVVDFLIIDKFNEWYSNGITKMNNSNNN